MDNKTTPQQIGGTITISSGEEVRIQPDSIQNKESDISSTDFIKKFKKAITEGIFKTEDGQGSANESTK